MTTYHDETAAYNAMRQHNRSHQRADLRVLVSGPEDGDYTVMSLRDAIDSDFAYEWAS